FAAWRRFLEAMAEAAPLVAVFEDIHWADPALIGFLDDLVRRSNSSPMVVLSTARPELYDRHTAWTEDVESAEVVSLGPLDPAETAVLIEELLGVPARQELTTGLVMERSGGNPLYAEELIRGLRDRGLLDGSGRLTADATAVTFPESVQTMIAARLDTLALDRKAVIQDA